MPGIIPEAGPIFREQDGTCQTTSAQNTYCPDPNFVVSCPLRALPSDCTARLDPAQINAMVSELMAFGEALCPSGEWDCESVTNLANLWNEGCWLETICDQAEPVEFNENIAVLGCSAGSLVSFNIPGPFEPCEGENPALIAGCIISADEDNSLGQGEDSLLYVPPFVPCDHAGELAECLISADEDNSLGQGEDGLLYVPPADPYNPCDDAPQIAACIISGDEENNLQLGDDELLWGRKAGFYAAEVNSGGQTEVFLDTAGSTAGPGTSLVVTNPSTTEAMLGILRFTTLVNGHRRIGDGSYTLTNELSFDGGATWVPLAAMNVQRAGSGTLDTNEYLLDNRATANVNIPPGATIDFRHRPTINVLTPYGAGSYGMMGSELEIICGTEWPA